MRFKDYYINSELTETNTHQAIRELLTEISIKPPGVNSSESSVKGSVRGFVVLSLLSVNFTELYRV